MKFIQAAFLVMALVAISLAGLEAKQANLCPDMCLSVYEPVCASNKTCVRAFGNRCELYVFNCSIPPRRRYIVIPDQNCNSFSSPNYDSCDIKADTTVE